MTDLTRRDFLKLTGYGLMGMYLPKPDLKSISIDRVNDPELLHEEKEMGSLVAKSMPVHLYPLRSDYFYQFNGDLLTKEPASIDSVIVDSMPVNYKNIYTQTLENGAVHKYIVLPYVTGSKNIPIGLLESGHFDENGHYTVDTEYYSEKVNMNEKVGDCHTVMAEFYPNKIINIFEAMIAIDEWQQKNGGFKKDIEYSFLEMLNLDGRDGYVLGKTSAGNVVRGGGVCVTATNFAKLQILGGCDVVERWEHPSGGKYWTGPVAGHIMRQSNSDTTVELNPNGNYDFRWIAPKDGFVELKVDVISNGNTVKNPFGDPPGLGNIADAMIIFSMKSVSTDPNSNTVGFDKPTQAESIAKLKQRYIDFRENNTVLLGIPAPLSVNKVVRTEWYEDDTFSKFLKSIYPEEKQINFKTEIDSDEFISSIARLAEIINGYELNQLELVGSHIKNSDWYMGQVDKLDLQQINWLDAILRNLDYNTNLVEGQIVQCVGFASIMSAIYSQISFPRIPKVERASELIPSEIKNGIKQKMLVDNCYAVRINTIDDLKPGDLFVNFNNQIGHVGAVIGKKIVNEKTVFLFADANRKLDGKVRIFEVNENNFEAIFSNLKVKAVLRT